MTALDNAREFAALMQGRKATEESSSVERPETVTSMAPPVTPTRYRRLGLTDVTPGSRWVIVCLACEGLAGVSRSDALTCSPACRVWLHRHPTKRTDHVAGLVAAGELSGFGQSKPEAVLLSRQLRYQALRLMLPDLAEQVRAGRLGVEGARQAMNTEFSRLVARRFGELTRPRRTAVRAVKKTVAREPLTPPGPELSRATHSALAAAARRLSDGVR